MLERQAVSDEQASVAELLQLSQRDNYSFVNSFSETNMSHTVSGGLPKH